jgi:hypothetical protein
LHLSLTSPFEIVEKEKNLQRYLHWLRLKVWINAIDIFLFSVICSLLFWANIHRKTNNNNNNNICHWFADFFVLLCFVHNKYRQSIDEKNVGNLSIFPLSFIPFLNKRIQHRNIFFGKFW